MGGLAGRCCPPAAGRWPRRPISARLCAAGPAAYQLRTGGLRLAAIARLDMRRIEINIITLLIYK